MPLQETEQKLCREWILAKEILNSDWFPDNCPEARRETLLWAPCVLTIKDDAKQLSETLRNEWQTHAISSVEAAFRSLADRWRHETRHTSSLTRMISNQYYLRIIGLGREVVPVILKELMDRPDHWLVALNAITGHDPSSEGSTFNQAVEAWLTWGRKTGHLK